MSTTNKGPCFAVVFANFSQRFAGNGQTWRNNGESLLPHLAMQRLPDIARLATHCQPQLHLATLKEEEGASCC